jgi:tetratricopeptide (TPR) repeat protein
LAEGFILTPFFAEALPAYEKQESAMRLYFPELMGTMDTRKEIKRLDAADLTTPPPKRATSTAAVDPIPAAPRDVAAVTIDEAEKLYEGRDLEKAAEAFRKALQQTERKPLHARSYYGLARIAALQRNPELAEQLFRKTLELSPDPHTHAWSEVYLGRLALATAAPDDAAKHFKAALSVEGATERAKQAAEEGLSKTSK